MEQLRIDIDKAIQLVRELIDDGRRECANPPVQQTHVTKWFGAASATLEHIFGNDSGRSGLMNSALTARPNPFRQIPRNLGEIDKQYLLEAYLNYMSGLLARLETHKRLNAEAPLPTDSIMPNPPTNHKDKVFIVHGRDDAAKVHVARLVDRVTCQGTAIILHEQENRGRTILDKFQEHAAEVGFAIVLLTPDDLGGLREDVDSSKSIEDVRAVLFKRARSNVIFELGYFLGQLGKGRVSALRKDETEIPSDFSGVVYIAMDQAGAWETKLAKELRTAGYNVDMNKL